MDDAKLVRMLRDTDTPMWVSDLVAAADRIEAMAAQIELWRTSRRETFDAMCAMRDSINEHIPMPSLESDLLQGPEDSVFCATVAEAVINHVSAHATLIAERDAAIARLTEENKRLTHDLCSDRLLVIDQGKKLDEAFARADAAEAALSAARDAALEEAARIAETLGVHPQLNVWGGGPDWFKHGKNIAAAIRALKGKSHE